MSDGIGIPYTRAKTMTSREAELLRQLGESHTSLTKCQMVLGWFSNELTRNNSRSEYFVTDQQIRAIGNQNLRRDVLAVLKASEDTK